MLAGFKSNYDIEGCDFSNKKLILERCLSRRFPSSSRETRTRTFKTQKADFATRIFHTNTRARLTSFPHSNWSGDKLGWLPFWQMDRPTDRQVTLYLYQRCFYTRRKKAVFFIRDLLGDCVHNNPVLWNEKRLSWKLFCTKCLLIGYENLHLFFARHSSLQALLT